MCSWSCFAGVSGFVHVSNRELMLLLTQHTDLVRDADHLPAVPRYCWQAHWYQRQEEQTCQMHIRGWMSASPESL